MTTVDPASATPKFQVVFAEPMDVAVPAGAMVIVPVMKPLVLVRPAWAAQNAGAKQNK